MIPKSVGSQVINVGIESQWASTGNSKGTDISRQNWEFPIANQVNKSFIDVGHSHWPQWSRGYLVQPSRDFPSLDLGTASPGSHGEEKKADKIL